jgi:hypothetical protein
MEDQGLPEETKVQKIVRKQARRRELLEYAETIALRIIKLEIKQKELCLFREMVERLVDVR